jgi:hypothetical protein
MEDRGRPRRLVDMLPNTHIHRDMAQIRENDLLAQARHADLIRRARTGQLQPELESGRRHERRTRLATLLHGRPAPIS